jgi:hypothetical protein
MLQNLLNSRDRQVILKIPDQFYEREDTMVWTVEAK